MFTIRLSDGSEITGLTLNCNTFGSKSEITREMFEGKLSGVTIATDQLGYPDEFGLLGEHEQMKFGGVYKVGNEWQFMLYDKPSEELERERVEARLDYIEMMEELA